MSDRQVVVQLNIERLEPQNDGYGVNSSPWIQFGRWVKYEEVVQGGGQRYGTPTVPIVAYGALVRFRKVLATRGRFLSVKLPRGDGRQVGACGLLQAISSGSRAAKLTQPELAKLEDVLRGGEDAQLVQRAQGRRASGVGVNGLRNLRRVSIEPSGEGVAAAGIANVRRSSHSNAGTGPANSELHDLLEKGKLAVPTPSVGARRRSSAFGVDMTPTHDIDTASSQLALILVGATTPGAETEPTLLFIRISVEREGEGDGVDLLLPGHTDASIPVRFLLILLTPGGYPEAERVELGRAVAILCTNKSFQTAASTAVPDGGGQELISALDAFLEQCVVVPPAPPPMGGSGASWDLDLVPMGKLETLLQFAAEKRPGDHQLQISGRKDSSQDQPEGQGNPSGGRRRRRPFGGVHEEMAARLPLYWSDITDALNSQCLAATIFVYFACVSGNIAFGGLMAAKTGGYIGISETLMAAAVGGVLFASLSAQPLLIIGTTGPVLVFDESLYALCTNSLGMSGPEFLVARAWVGIWLGVVGLVFAAFDGARLLKFFTRFTQEIFAVLIAFVFIIESLQSLAKVYVAHPLLESGEYRLEDLQQPNVALLSTVLMFGTYTIATGLRGIRATQFLTPLLRNTIANFAVLLSIVAMCGLDFAVRHVGSPKLELPSAASGGLQNSHENRTSWFINVLDIDGGIPLWVIIPSAAIPALLLFIFIFMETGICELIVGKKESRLRKGTGPHTDLLLMCLINTLMGLFGLGWVSAPTIRSVAHLSALTLYSVADVPGEKPVVVGVLEQRPTAFLVSALIGCSVLMADVLVYIPLAVLFGIFLYMGFTSLQGVQLVERSLILFKQGTAPLPAYLANVRRWKVNTYTALQLVCLALLWAVKESPASLALALLILLLVPLRIFGLKRWFAVRELDGLDGS